MNAVPVNAAAAIATYRGLDGTVTDAVARALPEAVHAVDSAAAAATLVRWATAAATADDTGT